MSASAAWSEFVLSFCQACTVPTFIQYLFAGMRPFLCSVKLLVIICLVQTQTQYYCSHCVKRFGPSNISGWLYATEYRCIKQLYRWLL